MFLRELRKIVRPHWFDILFTIKRSSGLSVTELSKVMKMSYMGVKQHCDDLEKIGLLDTWRRPREEGSSGRPEKAYRLTPRANIFFPNFDNEFTTSILAAVKDAFGGNAPEKLIISYLNNKVRYYQHHIKGANLLERATSFAIIRNREGFLCVCENNQDSTAKVQIIEYHNPLREIFEKYPAASRTEQTMMEHSLGCSLSRKEEQISGLTRTVLTLNES
ncbi:hypothetical protein N9260_01530 [bacterium]|nr:hypothetical protein [bacterium]